MASRHRRVGRRLDRHSQERVALFRNMTMSLFERFGTNKEHILTSIAKAKEVRSFAEKIVTLGIKCRKELDAAAKIAGFEDAVALRKEHESSKKSFKKLLEGKSDDVKKKFNEHMSHSLHFRRLIVERLGTTTTPTHRAFEFREQGPRHERAIAKLVDEIAPRFIARSEENPKNAGGYTRVLKTSSWVKGDGSTKALWGFIGGQIVRETPAETADKKQTVGAK
jgi:large subunit ribosomal protein L17